MSSTSTYLVSTIDGHSLWVQVTVTAQKPETNQTVVFLELYAENGSDATLTPAGSSYLGIGAVNGGAAQKRVFTAPAVAPGETVLLGSQEVTVTHAEDGTATDIPIVWHWNVQTDSTNKGTAYIDLETLDLASKPAVSRFYCPIGQNVTISMNPAHSGLRHTLRYQLGETEGIIAEDVAEHYDWVLPEELLYALTENTQDTCIITCVTFHGETQLGSKTCVCIVQAGAAGAITAEEGWCTITPGSDNEIVKGWSVYLDGYSYVTLQIDESRLSFSLGASLKKITMAVNGKMYSETWKSAVLNGTHRHTVHVTVTDSRGTTLTYTENVTPLPWNPPTIRNAVCYRCLADGTADDGGNYLYADCERVYSPVEGNNSTTVVLRLYAATGALLKTETVEEAGVFFGSLNAQSAYRATMVITDALGGTGSISFIIPSQTVAFQIKEGGDGAAFGGAATESDCLDIKWSKLNVGGEPVADFPVETGTSGIWRYCKWRSGRAQCWGTLTGTLTADQSWGSLYTTTAVSTEYPFTFATAPVVQVSAVYAGCTDHWLRTANSGGSRTMTPAYAPVTVTKTEVNYRMDFFVQGDWK